jgi:light-regulated signal transduction histidine kinase (bacteriophytochrome)
MARQIAQSLSEADPDRFFQIKIGTLPRAQADAGLLESVFANLIGNAIKFSRHTTPSRIEIDWMKQNGEVVYFVRDNGAGFEMKYANKLFGVFERLHGSEFEGTGIGLATVKRSVQKHGGRIWAESTRNEGATFYFTLGDLSVGPELQSAEHSNVSENRDKFPRKLNSYDRTHCPSGMDLFRPMSVRMS